MKVTEAEQKVRVWCIGSDGSEYYAAYSEEQMRQYYVQIVGPQQATEDIADWFVEVPESELDTDFDFNDNGKIIITTWRKQIAGAQVPCQISSGYL